MNENLVDKIRKRLAEASSNDRRYERPMNWEEADALIALIDKHLKKKSKTS